MMPRSVPVAQLPHRRFLPLLYRKILGLTRKHGLFTLARFHDRFFGGMQRVDIPGGGSLIIPDDSHYFGFLAGVHEQHVEALIRDSVAPGDVCIDVGANIGYFSMMMAKAAGMRGRVIAFEPVPDTFDVLKQNATLAAEEGGRLEAHQAAVSAQAGELIIERQEHSTLNQVRQAHGGDAGERVPCVELAGFLDSVGITGQVALLKVDVEGHEMSVVQGALPVLASGRVKRMILEVTPGEEAGRIEGLLTNCGARIHCWIGDRWQEGGWSNLGYRTDVLIDFPSRED